MWRYKNKNHFNWEVFHAYPSRVPGFIPIFVVGWMFPIFVVVLFCLSSFCLLCSVLPVSLNHPFLIASSLFSNVYSARFRCEQFHTETCIKKEKGSPTNTLVTHFGSCCKMVNVQKAWHSPYMRQSFTCRLMWEFCFRLVLHNH